jgi:hypothetical protein
VKNTPLLVSPLAVTTTFPVVAPLGTVAVMLVVLQTVVAAVTPLKLTVPLDPKLVPEITTDEPTDPEVGFRPLMLGAGGTVKLTPLLATPFTVTVTFPVVAPFGTIAVILAEFQAVVVAVRPLNVTVPLDPKFVPEIVTDDPGGPDVGLRLLMFGVGSTVKATPLLATEFTVTTTFPLVAPLGTIAVMLVGFQALVVAVVPLNVTVPLDPKFVPEITTAEATGPEVGFRPLMFGVGSTVKATPLLATEFTVTTTFPLVAPFGTVVVMLVEFQAVVVAVVPLYVTDPVDPNPIPDMVTEAPTGPELPLRLFIPGAPVPVMPTVF